MEILTPSKVETVSHFKISISKLENIVIIMLMTFDLYTKILVSFLRQISQIKTSLPIRNWTASQTQKKASTKCQAIFLRWLKDYEKLI